MGLEKVLKKIETFTKDQLAKRETRVNDPGFKLKMDALKNSAHTDFGKAGKSACDAAYRLTFGPFVEYVQESNKEYEKKRKAKKKGKDTSSFDVNGKGLTAYFTELSKGVGDAIELVFHLSKGFGKTAIRGTRYLIGY